MERYLTYEKELYSMRNILYMDRIATACCIYRGKHMEHLDEQDDDGEEEELDEKNKEQSGNEEDSMKVMSDSCFGIESQVPVFEYNF